MKTYTRYFLAQIEIVPKLICNVFKIAGITSRLEKEIAAGEDKSAEIAVNENLIAEGTAAYQSVFRRIEAIPDLDVRLILIARALASTPWDLLRLPDGTDGLDAVIQWLDDHEGEV